MGQDVACVLYVRKTRYSTLHWELSTENTRTHLGFQSVWVETNIHFLEWNRLALYVVRNMKLLKLCCLTILRPRALEYTHTKTYRKKLYQARFDPWFKDRVFILYFFVQESLLFDSFSTIFACLSCVKFSVQVVIFCNYLASTEKLCLKLYWNKYYKAKRLLWSLNGSIYYIHSLRLEYNDNNIVLIQSQNKILLFLRHSDTMETLRKGVKNVPRGGGPACIGKWDTENFQ